MSSPPQNMSLCTPQQPLAPSTHIQTMLTSDPQLPPSAMSPSQLPTSLSTSNLEEEIGMMEGKFEELVETIEDSFLECSVSVVKIKRLIKHIPMSLKLQLGEYFREHTSPIIKANSVEEIFNLLSFFWDYLNPGLLVFIVGRLGSPNDIDLVRTYSKELELFRKNVKVGDFVHANRTESRACHHYFYKKIVSIVGDHWKNKSLEDMEDYRIKLSIELQFQPFLTQIHVKRSSIAIVFSIPHWIQINFEELEPFFRSNGVIKVCLEDLCVIDWTNQVNDVYNYSTEGSVEACGQETGRSKVLYRLATHCDS